MERVTAGVLAAVMALGMTGCANSGMSGTTTDLYRTIRGPKRKVRRKEPEQTDRQDRQKIQERRILQWKKKYLGAIREAFEVFLRSFP